MKKSSSNSRRDLLRVSAATAVVSTRKISCEILLLNPIESLQNEINIFVFQNIYSFRL